MDLEPYGWYSPAQIAARTVQRLEMRAARRGITVPETAGTVLRVAAEAGLHAIMALERLDRRLLAVLASRR